ncbi:MAG: YgeY family selenium metabolism-linked hydrolase, partial [Syntrophomonas sp.]
MKNTGIKFTTERQDQLVTLCQNLIRTKSYSGHEKKAADEVKSAFLELGFDEILVDKYGSIIGQIKGNRPGPKLLFDGHLDTVPVPEESDWSHGPFSGEIVEGKIYGRGASDMKGAVAAMVCAAAFFAQDSKRDFAGDLYVVGSVQEECFEGISSKSVSEQIKPDYVVIGEASVCNVKRGQKGRAEIVVETFGKPAHSANPNKGINAVYKAARLIDEIRKLEMSHHSILGDGILELTDIKSSPYPGASVVPDYCRITYDRRLLVGETPESVIKPILDLIVTIQHEDPQFEANAYFAKGQEECYTGAAIGGERYFPAWVLDEQDEYVQTVLKALK